METHGRDWCAVGDRRTTRATLVERRYNGSVRSIEPQGKSRNCTSTRMAIQGVTVGLPQSMRDTHRRKSISLEIAFRFVRFCPRNKEGLC